MRGKKSKTIRKALRSEFDKFVSSIDDPAVKERVEKNTIITGGSIASMLLGEEVKDYDLYFRDLSTTVAVAEYYVKKFREIDQKSNARVVQDGSRVSIEVPSEGVTGDPRLDDVEGEIEHDSDHPDKGLFVPVFLSQNAITLSDQVQLIIRFYGEPDEIHKNYDFVHCTNYWTSCDSKLILHQAALESLLSKELVYQGSLYPVCSIIRLRKFISRGWVINAGQILKMVLQVSELDLMDLKVLEDQLTGVDSAYFMQLLEAVKDDDPSKINASYISEIIDRIF